MGAQVSAADEIGMVKRRLSILTWRLHDLGNDGTKEVIENCRVMCDLKSLLEKIYQKGSVILGLEEAKHHSKCSDCRRRRFDESLSNVCSTVGNTIY